MENNSPDVKKRSTRRAPIIITIVVILALAAAAGGRLIYDSLNPSETTEEDSVNIRVTLAEAGDIEISSIYTGKLAAVNEVSVVPKIPGRVVSVDATLGDKVSAGDVLFRLDTADVQRQVNQAQIQYDAAKAAYDGASDAVKAAESMTDAAKKAASEIPAVPDSPAMPGLPEVADPDAISLTIAAAKEQAQQALSQAEAALAQARAGRDQADVQLKLAQEGLNAAQAALAECTVTAPIGGRLTSLNVQRGGMASQAMPSASISDIDALQIETGVSETMVNRIKEGDSTEIYVRAISDEPIAGKIKTVVPAPPTGAVTYPVVVELPNDDGRLKPGMFAEIRMTTDRATDVVVIPSDAVLIKTGKEIVVVIGADDSARWVEVETGLDDGSLVEIKSGLKRGDKVVSEGQYYLDEDSAFKIIE
ncbi:MAG: efflux RND transporter periplasmic adaptor subunit [Clostridiales Family XIII bacterium]|jgi:RND family efflux transporter MFP subunit|nr:efflux RND transporter periplasmic adaptor subunit [Clostridiales Family XIII bacterium]